MDLHTLRDHVVVLFGGAGGIGAPVAGFLAERGATVIVVDLQAAAARAIAEGLAERGLRATGVGCDIAVEAAVDALIETTVQQHQQIDALVNLATRAGMGPLLDFPVESFDQIVGVNLRGAFLASRAAARQMSGQPTGGRIVLFSSVTSLFGSPGQAVYGMTKAAISGLVKSMALEWIGRGVRVNALSPTTTDTPLAKDWLDSDPELRATLARTVPVGRLAEPADMFGALEFLLTDASRFMVGQTLYVDGGVSVTHPLIRAP